MLCLSGSRALCVRMREHAFPRDPLQLHCRDDLLIHHRTLDHTQMEKRDVGKAALSRLDRGSMSHHKSGHRAYAHHSCQYAGQPQRFKRSTGLALSIGDGKVASGGNIISTSTSDYLPFYRTTRARFAYYKPQRGFMIAFRSPLMLPLILRTHPLFLFIYSDSRYIYILLRVSCNPTPALNPKTDNACLISH